MLFCLSGILVFKLERKNMSRSATVREEGRASIIGVESRWKIVRRREASSLLARLSTTPTTIFGGATLDAMAAPDAAASFSNPAPDPSATITQNLYRALRAASTCFVLITSGTNGC